MTSWVFLLVAAVLNSVANIFIKKASSSGIEGVISQVFSPYFLAGMVLFGLNVVVYSLALRSLPISIAYPVFVSASTVLITAISYLIFKDSLSLIQIAGVFVIMGGISMLVYGH